MVWATYKEKIKRLSQRIVESQRPIRILDAIKWDASVEEFLIKKKFREMPKIDTETYANQPLGFEVRAKLSELIELRADIESELGKEDELGGLLTEIVDEYIDVVQMLEARGTKRFWELSCRLYGSPKSHFHDEKNTIISSAQLLYEILGGIEDRAIAPDYPEELSAENVVDLLNDRFNAYFGDTPVKAKLSDGILADAAAGGDVVKIREGSMFSTRDVDILEVHEGWVHVGTTQNGAAQHVATWLSKGPPRCSSTQEGLAVIMEIFTFRSYPRRARHINDRILAIDKAEDGANLLEVIEFFRTEGYSERECITNAKRVFRGGLVEGGAPFTKDISYCRGFIENYNFMRAAIRAGKAEMIPFLFAGKLRVDDVPLIYQKHREGIIDAPKFIPPQFKDLSAIAVWLSFSSFFNMVDLRRIQAHYNKLFERFA
jgi:uncharacterized protein (TIGR02421 family)